MPPGQETEKSARSFACMHAPFHRLGWFMTDVLSVNDPPRVARGAAQGAPSVLSKSRRYRGHSIPPRNQKFFSSSFSSSSKGRFGSSRDSCLSTQPSRAGAHGSSASAVSVFLCPLRLPQMTYHFLRNHCGCCCGRGSPEEKQGQRAGRVECRKSIPYFGWLLQR
jgi:hypothetical protein